ncbi:RNA-dependent RNA polymerase [Mexico trichovirus]|uniref:RNA-dependent RNA polymerase n=1 Tax=peach virus M TaxID=3070926 RepID=A0AA48YTS5_9VIRU|nr:RNA-dependent RNA polymerase [Mexico trichovirus]QDR50348.1 RNA-dependent RNA polymerase [peach virus M]
MAFSYRTPQEELLNRLPQTQQEIISNLQFERLQKEEERRVVNFSYALPEKTKEWFTKSGVYLSPFAYEVHSHPGCKTLENHILYNIVAPNISKYPYVACLSIKANKMSKMEKMGPHSVKNYDIFNRLVTSRDKSRYGDLTSPSRVGGPKGANYFIHDEVHYWSRAQLETFLEFKKPRNLWVTVVYPPEVMKGYKSSILPFLYEFELDGDKLIYMPDGVRSESYTQSIENGYLLATSSISFKNKDGARKQYSVSLVYSLGSHHVFHIFPSQGLIEDDVRRFGPYDIFDVGTLFKTPVRVPIQDFPLSTFKKIFIYLSSLKKPDEQSAVAKLRQLCDSEISIESVFLIQEFAKRVERGGIKDWACSFFDCLKDHFFDKLPFKDSLEKIGLADDFTRRLINLKPLSFDIRACGQSKSVRMIFEAVWPEFQFEDKLAATVTRGREAVLNGNAFVKGISSTKNFLLGKENRSCESYPDSFQADDLAHTPLRLSMTTDYGREGLRTPVVFRTTRKEHLVLPPTPGLPLCIGFERFYGKIEKTDYQKEVETKKRSLALASMNFHAQKTKMDSPEGYLAYVGRKDEQARIQKNESEVVHRKKAKKYVYEPVSLDNVSYSKKKAIGSEEESEEKRIETIKSQTDQISEKGKFVMIEEKPVKEPETGECSGSKIESILGIEKWILEPVCKHGLMKHTSDVNDEIINYLEGLNCRELNGRGAVYVCNDAPMVYFHNDISYPSVQASDAFRAFMEKMARDYDTPFNSALVQIYAKGSRLGMHKDNESCYGDDPILTLNLRGEAAFSVDCCDSIINLKDGDELLMPQGFQKKYRHGVMSESDARLSVTLRVHRRDFSFEEKVRFVRGKYDCLFVALAEMISRRPEDVMMKNLHELDRCIMNKGCNIDDLRSICMGYEIKVECQGDCGLIEIGEVGLPLGRLLLRGNHFSLCSKRRSNLDSLANSSKEVSCQAGGVDYIMTKFLPRLRMVEPDLSSSQVKVDIKRAGKLLKSLMEGMTGVVSHNSTHDGWRILKGVRNAADMRTLLSEMRGSTDGIERGKLMDQIEELNFRKVTIHGIFGFAGSGKSYAIQNLVSTEFKKSQGLMVVCPRRFLAKDWSEKGVEEVDIKTFESALKSDIKTKRVIILDEISLLPRGFTDLLMVKMHMEGTLNSSTIICLGDPLQANYFSQKDDSYLEKEPEIKRLFPEGIEYKWFSYRINRMVARQLSVPTLNDFPGIDHQGQIFGDVPSAIHSITKTNGEVEVILVASMIEKELYSALGRVMTFGESQGLTFGVGIIVLSEEAKLCSDNHIIVAMTRFCKGFSFALGSKGTKEEFLRGIKNGVLSRVCSNIPVSKEYISSSSPVKLNFSEKLIKSGAGIDEMDREERLSGDPWLKTQIFLGKRYHLREPLGQVCKLEDSAIKCHIPMSNHQTLYTELSRMKAREHREFKGRDGWSSQFREEAGPSWKAPYRVAQPMNFEAIYPRHKMDDDITFYAAIKKRLRFAGVADNYVKFKQAKSRGQYLLNVFLKHVDLKPNRNQRILDQCRQEFEETKLSKSAATIGAHAQRSDPDWPLSRIFLFMKSQLCTKFEKRFEDAKAGQTLACFQHRILVEFSPWCRYVEKVISSSLPDNFYIHQRKNFSELEDFSRRYSNGSTCVESDYTAFDVSQDHTILAFEVELLRYIGWDGRIIDSYITMKCTLGCRLGGFAIMRFTGEFSTFLFNTLANMAFTFCRYEVKKGTPICFAGDDMCALRNLREIDNHAHILDKLSLKAKVNRTSVPMFCGWRLCQDGLIKEPCLIYERLCVAIENGRLLDVIDSYYLEFSFAYKLGERLFQYLEIEQLNYHQVLTRFFVKNKHLLRGGAKESISELCWLSDEDGSDDEGSQIKDRRRGYSNFWSEKLQNLF